MGYSSTPTFPDELYTEQAAYLADHTAVTEREAEAYLRRAHVPDDDRGDVLDRTLAKQMSGGGVSKSTFSKHLNNAQAKLEGDEPLIDTLTSLLLTTDLGGANGYSRQVTGTTKTKNGFVLISETEFYDKTLFNKDAVPAKYRAHILFRERVHDVDFENMPSDIAAKSWYTKHSLFTVEAHDESVFVDSVAAYIDELEALDPVDLVNTIDLLEDLGFPDDGEVTENRLQDARENLHSVPTR